MFPDSVAAVAGFLFVVAPGLVFHAIRERRRPAIDKSPFREISSVAFASVVFSSFALLLIALARFFWPTLLPDFEDWLKMGESYLASHLREVVAFLAAWATLANVAAVVSASVIFRNAAKIDSHTTAWFEVFRKRKPRETRAVALVQLSDGTAYVGEVVYYDAHVLVEDRELILGPPLWRRVAPREQLVRLPETDDWRRVVVPGKSISSMWVRYPPKVN